jgi:hypothetical protein
MNITFKEERLCNCYRDLVNSGGGRMELKRFSRYFGDQITSSVLKLHQRLKNAENAACYNSIAGNDNKIEELAGRKNDEPLVLKVRIQSAFRKFFYYMISGEKDVKCSQGNWTGQFNRVEDIHVFEINKHNYNKL